MTTQLQRAVKAKHLLAEMAHDIRTGGLVHDRAPVAAELQIIAATLGDILAGIFADFAEADESIDVRRRADKVTAGRRRVNSHALFAFRQVSGLTLTELAAKARTSDSFLSRLERGERQTCATDVVAGLAQALGVPVLALLAASEKVEVAS